MMNNLNRITFNQIGWKVFEFRSVILPISVYWNSSQLQPASRHGLEALCALGLKSRDVTLTHAVLQELVGTEMNNSGIYFTVLQHGLLEENWELAKSFLEKCIHWFPDKYTLWRLLSRLQLRHHHGNKPSTAAMCMQAAMSLEPKCQVKTIQTLFDNLIDFWNTNTI